MAKSTTQSLYWAAPYWVKCWMASWYGYRAGQSRFGKEYERLLLEITDRDDWPRERFAEYQNQQLRRLLAHAAAHVPFYRRWLGQANIDPRTIETISDLQSLPILEKQTAREHSEEMLDERLDRRKLVRRFTSGTTGTPLQLYRDAREEAATFAYLEKRYHAIAGVRRRYNRSVSLGGHLVCSPQRKKPPFWVLNSRWNQLYMSSYHLSPQYLDAYVAAIRDFAPDYIEGYPSSIYAVAYHIVENALPPIPLKAAFTTAENIFDYQRDAVQKAFGCRTYAQYGCGEQVVLATECEEGSLHFSPEVGIVEVVGPDNQPVPPGVAGNLVCTSLINFTQPFIRYRLGDVGAVRAGGCTCGRTLPVLDQIEGRIDAVLITRDGRRLGRLDPVFKGVHGIAMAQIVQDDYDRFRVRIVPGKRYCDSDAHAVVNNLGYRTGGAQIRVELVDRIERTAAGKFPAIVCNLPKQTRWQRGSCHSLGAAT